MKLLFCLAVYIVAVFAQDFNGGQGQWYCGILINEDCNSHHVHERCGTNGRTYRNMCELGQAHCKDNTIDQAHEGTCTVTTNQNMTTRSPDQVVHGSAVILDFQCMLLSQRNCTQAYNEKICGSDAQTYDNFCEYEKARCMHRDLHVAMLGDCNA